MEELFEEFGGMILSASFGIIVIGVFYAIFRIL